MNKYSGKQFEKDFIKSIPDNVWCYRLRDSGGWSNASNTRFTTNNICDFLVFDGELYAIELKKTSSKSLPFNNVKQHQIDGLLDAKQYNINSYLGIFLYDTLYFIDIEDYVNYVNKATRKSLPKEFCEEFGIKINKRKLQKYYRFELDQLFKGGV